MDDGETFDYQEGAFIHREFIFAAGTNSNTRSGSLRSQSLRPPGKESRKAKAYLQSTEKVRIEKVVVINAPSEWEGHTSVVVSEEGKGEKSAELRYWKGEGGKAAWAVVRDPGVGVGKGWEIDF